MLACVNLSAKIGVMSSVFNEFSYEMVDVFVASIYSNIACLAFVV